VSIRNLCQSPPLISAAFAASIVTCFASEENCAGLAIGTIDAAQHEIPVNAYALTGSGIPAALIRAHGRGGALSRCQVIWVA